MIVLAYFSQKNSLLDKIVLFVIHINNLLNLQAEEAVEAAGCPTMQVQPLNPSEKMEIITTYMSLFSKTLNEEQLATIIEAEQSNNPLYLKALLDEVGSNVQLLLSIHLH